MAIDVLIVSLGSTSGLRVADEELRDSLQRAGANVELVRPAPLTDVPTLMLTDLRWARAARAAALLGIERTQPRAVVYSSTTAALLWPRPGAIRFDAPASGNRPGRHGLWQRPAERRRLAHAPLLLPWSEGALAELPAAMADGAARAGRALVLPVPVELSGARTRVARSDRSSLADHPSAGTIARDIAAITYAANPLKKGLDRLLETWRRVRRPTEELVVTGIDPSDLAKAGLVPPDEGVRVTGLLAPHDYRALLRRAHVFATAPRREDYGVAQLEALAEGCQLVSTPAPGPYAALPIARDLDPRLVSDDLGGALRAALDDPAADYQQRAVHALAPFCRHAVNRVVAEELLPRLLALGR